MPHGQISKKCAFSARDRCQPFAKLVGIQELNVLIPRSNVTAADVGSGSTPGIGVTFPSS